MSSQRPVNAQLRSHIDKDGKLTVDIEQSAVPALADDEVLVEIEAAPINPSDMGAIFGVSSISTFDAMGEGLDRRIVAQMPPAALNRFAGRLGQNIYPGLEGCGVVVDAGNSTGAKALSGRRVSVTGSGMFAKYRAVRVEDCLPLPDDVTAVQAASAFVNPLTALGMIETAKADGHKAMLFTAAASSLGRMVRRLCDREGIAFIGVVRGDSQVEMLRADGVVHICDLKSPDFSEQLIAALSATGATLAFDAIAGGEIVNEILRCMEMVAVSEMAAFNRYGSSKQKQLYIYGLLDTAPTVLKRDFGFAFGINGWLLFHFLGRISPELRKELNQKVIDGLKTTFETEYGAAISLEDMLKPENIRAYLSRGTGGKYLVMPKGPTRL
ncbi:alcohol dehydrogenase catalytic domain-containing protein [Sphingobium chungbukense]|uniref:Enoyl reductase (ER) domain-containing protein n=1 Tax=Sphingobium chungbukense TaxID=56193 RepID=A0A0M3ASY5_9SPHN|nr:hypothetical protein [Sphingobium chungbukense]KKW91639.1 hypothetical protein YP76_14805 [Sphingobium chungbukense]